jgi:hypothetical protein
MGAVLVGLRKMVIALRVLIMLAILFPRFNVFGVVFVLGLSAFGEATHAECVKERIVPHHDDFGWVRGQPDVNGKPLWKLSQGSIVIYCGYSARDNRKPPIEWHWVSLELVQEPWKHQFAHSRASCSRSKNACPGSHFALIQRLGRLLCFGCCGLLFMDHRREPLGFESVRLLHLS